MNGMGWQATRFADLELLKALEIDSDMAELLGHLKMPKLLTMAYPTYKELTSQFLSTLEVTYHDSRHVRQGWGKIKFTIDGRVYYMNFKDIGAVMGFQDAEETTLPRCDGLPKKLWELITGINHRTGADKTLASDTLQCATSTDCLYTSSTHGNSMVTSLRKISALSALLSVPTLLRDSYHSPAQTSTPDLGW
ncbi:hypothetical protein Rs2_27583 [Raphanus sativus]|nr:hypothetical protein Rs2_27583 [Raphanus sativus]